MFLDEVNTSSCLGLFKEIIVDRTLDGNVSDFQVLHCNTHVVLQSNLKPLTGLLTIQLDYKLIIFNFLIFFYFCSKHFYAEARAQSK